METHIGEPADGWWDAERRSTTGVRSPEELLNGERESDVVTMREVALAAGLSQASVSNAYNRPERLSATQRAHILEVARTLGYPGPNPAGRSLRTGRVGAIGLMITDSLSYAFEDQSAMALVQGMAQVGELEEVALTLLPFPVRRADANGVTRLVTPEEEAQVALRGLVDGFLVFGLPDGHPAVEAAASRKLPMVIVDAPVIPGVPYVGVKDRQGAASAAEHLIQLGHTRIGVLIDRLIPDGYSGVVDAKRVRASTTPE